MIVVFGAAGVLLLLVVVWAGHRMVSSPQAGGGGMTDGLGVFNEAFDPARERADRELKSRDHEAEIVPVPEDDADRPVRIDHTTMRATIRRPRPTPPE